MTEVGVVAITGGTAGIGRATALRFARDGWRVGVIARDPQPLEDVRRELERLGVGAHAVSADVVDAAAVTAAADEIAAALGPIDVWINNAMVTVFAPLWNMTPEEFARVTNVTYLGCVHGTMAALRHMRARNSGHIVQVGSALAYRGIPLQSAYCGAKHAIRGFTASLRAELLHERSAIRVSMVELPAVNTPQFDWARTHMPRTPRPAGGAIYTPEAAADAIHHAVDHPQREYWLGGITAQTILGNMIAPDLLDHLVKGTYEGQQTAVPTPPQRPDNLMQPVTHHHRIAGSFGESARPSGLLISGLTGRLAAAGAGALVCIAIGAAVAFWLQRERASRVGPLAVAFGSSGQPASGHREFRGTRGDIFGSPTMAPAMPHRRD